MGREKVQHSSGNVFADLGIPNPEQYMAKAELAAKIFRIIEQRGLTQAKAGKLLGINQPKVSALCLRVASMDSPATGCFAFSMRWVAMCGSPFLGLIRKRRGACR